MILRYNRTTKTFICDSEYNELYIPKQAGFFWNKEMKKWITNDWTKAMKLADYADEFCRLILQACVAKQKKLLDLSKATDYTGDIPKPDGKEYYGFQKAGIAYALSMKRVLIGDEMRLGKTIQAVGVINSVDSIGKVLVITKASLKINWRNELHAWLVRPLSVDIANSSYWPQADIIIVNYDILQKHKKHLDEVVWDMLIIDEGHFLKNPKAIRTKMVFGYIPKDPTKKTKAIPAVQAEYVTILTGSPIENRPNEAFPLIHYLNPKYWASWWQYVQRYCNPTHNGYGWTYDGASNIEELQHKLRSTVMIRRTFDQVRKDLPPVRQQIVELPVDDEALRSYLMGEMEEYKKRSGKIEELKAAIKASRLAKDSEEYREMVRDLSVAQKVSFTEMAKVRVETAQKKLPFVIEYLRDLFEEDDSKVLVFGHHDSILSTLHREFPNSVMVNGRVEPDLRQGLVDSFQNDPKVKIFFGSIGAAGVGFNIAAARHVIFVEEDWVPERMKQALSRARNLGKKEPVVVTHLVLEGSLDAYIANTSVEKEVVIEGILDNEYQRPEVDSSSWGSKAVEPEKEKPEEDKCPF